MKFLWRSFGRVPRFGVPCGCRHRLGHRRPTPFARSDRLELFENAGGHGRGLFAIILMFRPVSGGHFNPIVSFVDAAFGGLSGGSFAYLPAQVAGCIVRCGRGQPDVLKGRYQLFGSSPGLRAHFLGEIVATLRPIVVIFALARTGRSQCAPAAVGAYIGSAYFFTSSTSFANPAITVGRIFTDTFAGISPSSVAPFVLAQAVGGAIALAVLRGLFPLAQPYERNLNER